MRKILRRIESKRRSKQAVILPEGVFDYKVFLPKTRLVPPRALVSYLADPVKDFLRNTPEIMFSNRGIARSLPQALNELGYIVDIVNFDNTSFLPKTATYDLLIQHGALNNGNLRSGLKASGKTIYFSTGSYWRYHNNAEKNRFREFKQRTGVSLPPDRLIEISEEKVNNEANGIIALGNQDIRLTYEDFPMVLNLDLACYPDKRTKKVRKDHSIGRSNFLFFAGGGCIHKGLDLAIEAFSDLSQHLYIIAFADDDFRRVYKKQLAQPNIHYIGNLPMRSQKYYDIFDKCSFAILPSCSEGQPGSIVECLNEGLIPIVTPDVHLDIEGYGYSIDASVQSIKHVIAKTSKLSLEEITQYSNFAHQKASIDHSPEHFIATFKKHILSVLESK